MLSRGGCLAIFAIVGLPSNNTFSNTCPLLASSLGDDVPNGLAGDVTDVVAKQHLAFT